MSDHAGPCKAAQECGLARCRAAGNEGTYPRCRRLPVYPNVGGASTQPSSHPRVGIRGVGESVWLSAGPGRASPETPGTRHLYAPGRFECQRQRHRALRLYPDLYPFARRRASMSTTLAPFSRSRFRSFTRSAVAVDIRLPRHLRRVAELLRDVVLVPATIHDHRSAIVPQRVELERLLVATARSATRPTAPACTLPGTPRGSDASGSAARPSCPSAARSPCGIGRRRWAASRGPRPGQRGGERPIRSACGPSRA
jgi:hypothetical protein